jgi:DNA sulfur modification protein DndB
MKANKLVLPTLRGTMGDWLYYVTLMPFKEIAKRVSIAEEIHRDQGLKKMIQREISDRTSEIVLYLASQEQRFFNSLILGIYDGEPQWQPLEIMRNEIYNEEEMDQLNKTFGASILKGNEKIFAIDGQHRSEAIKKTVSIMSEIENEENTVIFVAHKTTDEGVIRTRRLFTTLNRYAKPVKINEIIALDEEDNCAIITRNIVEDFDLLKGKVLFNKNRSISPKNKSAFTNIIVLYDIIKILLTDMPIFDNASSGEKEKAYISKRKSDENIIEKQKYVEGLFQDLFIRIPVLKTFIETKSIDRTSKKSSLLFKPVGQKVFFSALKIAIEHNKYNQFIQLFKENDFSLNNKTWSKIFIDEETDSIKTNKNLQRFAFQLIMTRLQINFKKTQKDHNIFDNFGLDLNDI